MKRKIYSLLSKLSLITLIIGSLIYFVALFFESKISEPALTIMFYAAMILEFISLISLIVQAVFFGFKPVPTTTYPKYQKVSETKIVDVKEIKETPEESLYKQYEELFKEGYITEEELASKRKELLNK